MLNDVQTRLCRTSYAAVVENNAALVEGFYDRLFTVAPELRAQFPTDLARKAGLLRATIQVALNMLDHPARLVPALRMLGQQHAERGVTADQFQLVAEVLIDTLADCAGPVWTPETSAAWQKLLEFIIAQMQQGQPDRQLRAG